MSIPGTDVPSNPICARMRTVRTATFGRRGRSAMARVLGIRPSTYQAYERDRTPPAELLAKAAAATGADLVWLITGAGSGPSAVDASSVPMIPIVGSTAAGPARFWPEDAETGPAADALLERKLADAGAAARRNGAVAEGGPVALVALDKPTAEGVWEFLDAPTLATRRPRAVAWRIDGDSMDPRYRDGDLVVTDPAESVKPGQAAVCRLRRQVGVTCKLVRPEGDAVRLVPVNEAVASLSVPVGDVVWMQPVVAAVRFGG